MPKQDKTNAMRILEAHKVVYKILDYSESGAVSGEEVAEFLGVPKEKCFKTLVTQGKSGEYYVFDVPVNKELDLKKAAFIVSEKYVEMIKSKDLLRLTGYIHGGCSPVGMKKFFRTTFDVSAKNFDKIYFSGGRIGSFLEVSPKDLEKVIKFSFADITLTNG